MCVCVCVSFTRNHTHSPIHIHSFTRNYTSSVFYIHSLTRALTTPTDLSTSVHFTGPTDRGKVSEEGGQSSSGGPTAMAARAQLRQLLADLDQCTQRLVQGRVARVGQDTALLADARGRCDRPPPNAKSIKLINNTL